PLPQLRDTPLSNLVRVTASAVIGASAATPGSTSNTAQRERRRATTTMSLPMAASYYSCISFFLLSAPPPNLRKRAVPAQMQGVYARGEFCAHTQAIVKSGLGLITH